MLDGQMIDPQDLRTAFGCLPTGVTVVSLLDHAGKPTGVTVGSFTSLSLSPALCLFSLSKDQTSAQLFDPNVPFVVNVLSTAQADLAWQFAKPRADKCDGVSLANSAVDAPRLAESVAHFACHTHAIHDGGDHIIIVGQILDYAHSDDAALVFYRGQMQAATPL
ncbi:MAG: flavin reductase family protein [Paracoccaceae bacterium]